MNDLVINNGKDITKALALINRDEKWLAKSCGKTVRTIKNWSRVRGKIPQDIKRVVEATVNFYNEI